MLRRNLIEDFFRGIDELLDAQPHFKLSVDVQNIGDTIVVRADVPGIAKEDLNVMIENGVLTISGERKKGTEKTGENFYLRERFCGTYSRSFQLPIDVDEKEINATMRDGVLQLILQRSSEAKVRTIRIE